MPGCWHLHLYEYNQAVKVLESHRTTHGMLSSTVNAAQFRSTVDDDECTAQFKSTVEEI